MKDREKLIEYGKWNFFRSLKTVAASSKQEGTHRLWNWLWRIRTYIVQYIYYNMHLFYELVIYRCGHKFNILYFYFPRFKQIAMVSINSTPLCSIYSKCIKSRTRSVIFFYGSSNVSYVGRLLPTQPAIITAPVVFLEHLFKKNMVKYILNIIFFHGKGARTDMSGSDLFRSTYISRNILSIARH